VSTVHNRTDDEDAPVVLGRLEITMLYAAKVIGYDDELLTIDVEGIGEITEPVGIIDILEDCDENGYPIGSIVTADLDPQLLREYLKDK